MKLEAEAGDHSGAMPGVGSLSSEYCDSPCLEEEMQEGG